MELPQNKHRNLQHRLSPDVKERALQFLGGNEGSPAGLRILELRQREMQELFGKIFGVPTKSSNNEWLRSKLLQAIGLPPRWRPAPTPPPSPPRDCKPGEFSRYGRRLRATLSASGTDGSEDEGEEQAVETRGPPTKRGRTNSGSPTPTQQVQQQQQQAQQQVQQRQQPPAQPAGGVSAILALQARAVAAIASHVPQQPVVLLPEVPSPTSAHGAPPRQHSSLPPPLIPAFAAAHEPPRLASVPVQSVSLAVPQRALARSHDLLSLLSEPSQQLASPCGLLASGHVLGMSMFAAQPASLSAQLHLLYNEWEDGRVSFGPF